MGRKSKSQGLINEGERMSDETINGWWTLITLLLSAYTIVMCYVIEWNKKRKEKNDRR